jgi:peptidoglycan-associated lipoprotein
MRTLTIVPVAGACVLALTLGACAGRPKPGPGGPAAVAEAGGEPRTQTPPDAGAPATRHAPGSQEELAATAGDRVFFDLDSHALDEDARSTLAQQAAWLLRNPGVRVRIAGNADERGTREYNLALGSRRAEAVRQALAARGVAVSRIDTISYGKERPIDPGAHEDAWAKNRNGHAVVIGFGE